MISKKLLLFGFLLLVFTVFLSVKTVQGFQANCSQISDCGTCGNAYGCTFCKTAKKCVNNNDFTTSCPNDTPINIAEDCIDCSSHTDCKTCSKVNSCAWCKKSNKCVSDLSINTLCPKESTASDPSACEQTQIDISGIPYMFDKNDSITALQSQLDSGVYSTDVDMKPTNTFDYSNISLSYPGDSVIPILGLQRESTGHLLKESLKTIVESAKISGLITTNGSKQPLLDAIQKESNFYIEQKKEYMKKFFNNYVAYDTDEESLKKIKQIDIRIMDLNDISGYVKGIEGYQNKFKEGYQNINQRDVFEYTLNKNKGASGYMQFLWLVNLIGIGTFLYFVNNK